MNNLKDILDQANQSINVNNKLHSAGTLTMNFHKPAGMANPYVRFEYDPQTIFNQTLGQVSGSMNIAMINMDKKVTNE